MEALSVSAMMPTGMVVVSGASLAYAVPIQPRGRPENRVASGVATAAFFSSVRRFVFMVGLLVMLRSYAHCAWFVIAWLVISRTRAQRERKRTTSPMTITAGGPASRPPPAAAATQLSNPRAPGRAPRSVNSTSRHGGRGAPDQTLPLV